MLQAPAAGLLLLLMQPQLPPVEDIEAQSCVELSVVDKTLWWLYKLSRKTDRTGDYEWKDPSAAERMGMELDEYVIGGMDPRLRIRAFKMFKALWAAGLPAGFTSGFRDDYRQKIAAGFKARTGHSRHGGSFHGGYGHGSAIDIVALGKTRAEQLDRNSDVWKWIDKHGKEFGLTRRLGASDPPHVELITHDLEVRLARSGKKNKYVARDKRKHTRVANASKQSK